MHPKKLVLASLLTITAAGFSTQAHAASAEDTVYDAVSNGGYIQIGAGLGSPTGSQAGSPSLESGMNINLALGWEWDVAPDLRVEFEYSRFAPGDKGLVTGVNLQAYMVNLAVDVPINGRFPQWEI